MPAIRTSARFRAGAIALTAAALLTGCGNPSSSDSRADSAPRAWDRDKDRAPSTMPAPASTPESVENALRALNTADVSVPRGASFQLEGERDARGARIWEIVVASKGKDQNNDDYMDEYDVTVSGDGSELLSRHRDMTPDDDVARLRFSKTTAQQAVRLAYAYRPSELDSLEIDTRDDGRIVWEVTQTAPGAADDDEGRVVLLNATTGNVLTPGSDD
ncbi:PepSY domain-containing protein [Streptomyces sp. NPDC048639]|uniref:PepSY domain-containing protein n=1 Tax=Streptomyces sp. NPDC048639 TaxID=3365581 RepID=UPI00371A471D